VERKKLPKEIVGGKKVIREGGHLRPPGCDGSRKRGERAHPARWTGAVPGGGGETNRAGKDKREGEKNWAQ